MASNNAGAAATDVKTDVKVKLDKENKAERLRWLTIVRQGGPLVLVDAFIRWTHLSPNQPMEVTPWTKETSIAFFRILVGCFIETIAFHCGIMISCYAVFKFMDVVRARKRIKISSPISGIRQQFRFSLIPLTLFYSSLTKLFLLFLLSIWRPASSSRATNKPFESWSFTSNIYTVRAFQMFDDDKLDREWVVRNVLGGMSAGFGLRVILDSHPIVTTVIIVTGWAVKTAMASLVSGWVGGDESTGAAWLAYSIP